MKKLVLDSEEAAVGYLLAKAQVIRAGFAGEIDWQDDLSFGNISEADFLRETAWVILSSGFRESVVKRCFGSVSESFLFWSNAQSICSSRRLCRMHALRHFNNPKKIDAILSAAALVAEEGFYRIKARILKEGVTFLRQMPFIGEITSYHLAKNIGLSVVKPDRHLVRVARRAGYKCPTSLCEAIASIVCEKLSVIDLVIWRFATINRNYADIFIQLGRRTTRKGNIGLLE